MAHLRLSTTRDRDWLLALLPPLQTFPETWQPCIAAVVWGLDVTTSGRADGREKTEATWDTKICLFRPPEGDWLDRGPD